MIRTFIIGMLLGNSGAREESGRDFFPQSPGEEKFKWEIRTLFFSEEKDAGKRIARKLSGANGGMDQIRHSRESGRHKTLNLYVNLEIV